MACAPARPGLRHYPLYRRNHTHCTGQYLARSLPGSTLCIFSQWAMRQPLKNQNTRPGGLYAFSSSRRFFPFTLTLGFCMVQNIYPDFSFVLAFLYFFSHFSMLLISCGTKEQVSNTPPITLNKDVVQPGVSVLHCTGLFPV